MVRIQGVDPLVEPSADPRSQIITELAKVLEGSTSPVEDVRRALDSARRSANLNAYITLTEDWALRAAELVEREMKAGRPVGLLAGITVSLKDNIYTRGVRTTLASKLYLNNVPGASADVVRALEEEGAVIVGKTNMHELASGVTGLSSYFGPARNPRDPERIAGGSSGGSAISVAIGSAMISIGTDTAGSVRIPAALCGVVGFKASYGSISTGGVFPLAWSLDAVGVLARTVPDAAYVAILLMSRRRPEGLLLRSGVNLRAVIEGADPHHVKLGYLEVDEGEGSVNRLFMDVMSRLESEGFDVRRVSLDLDSIAEPYRTIRLAEAAAVHADTFRTAPGDFSADVAELLRQGLSITAADYLNALRVRRLLITDVRRSISGIDALVTPTLPLVAPRISEIPDAESALAFRAAATRYTIVASFAGLPAISLPMGYVGGLPAGMQLMGDLDEDGHLFEVERAVEVALA
jgi:aspartyl-tRNA(Asn)/glutamyl-tRNA(Gln) amidotransferase subunit A